MKRFVVVAVLAGAIALALSLTGIGSAHSPRHKRVSFVAHFKGATNFVDNPPPSPGGPGPGDILTARSVVFNASDSRRLGRTSEVCTGVVKRPFTMQCDLTLLLKKRGKLDISGGINPMRHPWTLPVVGGSGRYDGASGHVRDTQLAGHRERLSLRLLP
jgi:hypothetical protein